MDKMGKGIVRGGGMTWSGVWVSVRGGGVIGSGGGMIVSGLGVSMRGGVMIGSGEGMYEGVVLNVGERDGGVIARGKRDDGEYWRDGVEEWWRGSSEGEEG
jgi:hypothetical protein